MPYFPEPDELAFLSAAEIEAKARDLKAEHEKALRSMATEYDKAGAVIRELKTKPRKVRLSVTVHSEDGKSKEVYEAPEPVETTAAATAISQLQYRAMSGPLMASAGRQLAETQARRRNLKGAIQREQEDHYRLAQRLAQSADAARKREAAQTAVLPGDTVNRPPPRSMVARLGLGDA